MQLLSEYGQLFTRPQEFFEQHQEPVRIWQIGYAVSLSLVVLASIILAFTGLGAVAFIPVIWAAITLTIAIPMQYVAIGLVYHLGIKILGEEGALKSITIFGASTALIFPYAAVSIVLSAAGVVWLSVIIAIIGAVHAIVTEVHGLETMYMWTKKKAAWFAILYPLILAVVVILLAFVGSLAFFNAIDPSSLVPPGTTL